MRAESTRSGIGVHPHGASRRPVPRLRPGSLGTDTVAVTSSDRDDALRAHLLVLLPVIGVLVVQSRRRKPGWSPEAEQILQDAARWQAAAAGVIGLHAALQVGIEVVSWMVTAAGPLPPPVGPLLEPALLLLTVANLGSGAVEWAFLVFWGLRARRGHPIPLLRGKE